MSTRSAFVKKRATRMVFVLLCVSVMGGIRANLVMGETEEDPRRMVPHIGAHVALNLFKSGRMILLDVHPEEGKSRSDIVGAFFIPSEKLDKIKLNIPEKMLVGVFCD